jgi:glycosyltransferase involved in cell wall biosynthesis
MQRSQLECPSKHPEPEGRLRVAGVVSRPRTGSVSSLTNMTRNLFGVLGKHHETTILRVPIPRAAVAVGALATSASNRRIRSWREATLFSPQVTSSQSRRASQMVAALVPAPDVILQIGSMFSSASSTGNAAPLCIRVDRSFHPEVIESVAWGPRRYREAFYRAQRRLYSRCNFIFTTSEWAREQLIAWHEIASERVVNVGTGMNARLTATPAAPPDGRRGLLFVGNNYRLKGVDVLLAAWPAIRQEVPDAELNLVGDPRDMHLPAPLPDAVRFHGPVSDRAALDSLFAASTALVLPSRCEGLAAVVLESFAFGRPVVATPVGALPEWVQDGLTGFVVPVDDSDALAGSCVRLLCDPDLAARMGEAGRRRVVNEGTWDAVVEKILPYLQRAAEEGARAGG